MKKILLVLIVLSSYINAINAQTEKGKYLLGVSSMIGLNGTGSNVMAFGYTKNTYEGSDDESSTVGFNLCPKLGIFVADNLAFGSDIIGSISSSDHGNDDYESTTKLLLFSPFIRYYLPKSKVLPYFEANGSVGSASTKIKDDFINEKFSSDLLGLGFNVGFNAFLSEKSSIDVSFGYNYYDVETTNTHVIALKVGFLMFLGGN